MSQNMQSTGARILLVEDDDTARLSLTRVLGRAGYVVDAVPDGEEAYIRLEQSRHGERYDIVLTDLLLREIDGVQVLRQARQLPEPPEVVLLTGYGTLQTAIEALRVGAFDYLLKPCKPEDLLKCIGEAWQRRCERRNQHEALASIAFGLARLQGRAEPAPEGPAAARPSRATQMGPLLIDRQNHAAYFEGEPLTLTPTEYALLCCLADGAGQMLTYGELARQVYRQPVDEGDAHVLLKTHIHNLRRKLAPEMIVNVRSVGYRLVALARS